MAADSEAAEAAEPELEQEPENVHGHPVTWSRGRRSSTPAATTSSHW